MAKYFEEMKDAVGKAKEAQRFVEIASQAVRDTREQDHRLVTFCDEAEVALNEGLGCVHKFFATTAAATSATTIGSGDRAQNEQDY